MCLNGRGVSVANVGCKLCHKPLAVRKDVGGEQSIAVWGCGHCFHAACLKMAENDTACPQCRVKATQIPASAPVASKKHKSESNPNARPDLEGHF